MKLILAIVLGYIIGDHLELKRQFRRLEKLVVSSVVPKPPRNVRYPVWFSRDTSYGSTQGMTYRNLIKKEGGNR